MNKSIFTSIIGLGLNNISALVRFRLVSQMFGIEGIALFSIAQNLVLILTSIGGNGSASEVLKLIKKYRENNQSYTKVLILNIIAGSMLCSLALIILHLIKMPLSLYASIAGYLSVINISLVATLLFTQNTSYGKFLIFSNFLQMLFLGFIYLSNRYTPAPELFVILTPVTQFVILAALLRKKNHSKVDFSRKINFDIQLVRHVLLSNKAGLMIGFASAASFFSFLLVRLATQKLSSIEATAYLAIVLQISNFYMLPLQNFLYAHIYPKTLASDFGLKQMLYELRLPYIGLVVSQIIIFLSLSPLIRIFFDIEPKNVISYVILIMVADYIKLLCVGYGFLMIGRNLNKLYFFIQSLSGLVLVATSIIALIFNINVCYAFVIYYLFYFLISLRYAKI